MVADMELYQIQQFLAVARLENISKAAEEIHTSQPALSRTMKMLEEELEVPLFTRTKNTITLNEYGRVAEKHARRVCEEAERLKSSVQDLYKKLHSMTIASVAPAPLWILPQAVKAVFPQISVSAELKESSEISAGLEDGSVQIGVFAEEVSDKKFFCKKCAEERLNFSVPKGHPMAKRKSVSFKDIDGLTMLLMSDIGFWHEIHRQKMPHSRFLLQNERKDFSTLVNESSLPSFSSNLTMNHPEFPSDRVHIPISDKEAHADFYAVCKKTEYTRLRQIFEQIGVL